MFADWSTDIHCPPLFHSSHRQLRLSFSLLFKLVPASAEKSRGDIVIKIIHHHYHHLCHNHGQSHYYHLELPHLFQLSQSGSLLCLWNCTWKFISWIMGFSDRNICVSSRPPLRIAGQLMEHFNNWRRPLLNLLTAWRTFTKYQARSPIYRKGTCCPSLISAAFSSNPIW